LQDKQAESLKERLVGRLALGGPREWRTVAWCIAQLGYSEKGMRRIIELTPSYRHALAEQQVGVARQRLAGALWQPGDCGVSAMPECLLNVVASKACWTLRTCSSVLCSRGQLGYSEKGMRRIIELTPSYRHTLAEQQVRGARPQHSVVLCWGLHGFSSAAAVPTATASNRLWWE
jgi:hypothetical protein